MQEYWSGLLFPSPGDLPDPGIEPPTLAGGFFTTEPLGKPIVYSKSMEMQLAFMFILCIKSVDFCLIIIRDF